MQVNAAATKTTVPEITNDAQENSSFIEEEPTEQKKAQTKKKFIYYTDGLRNLRVPEGTPCPEGFHRGRISRRLTPEQQQAANEARRKTCLERYNDPTYNNQAKSKKTCLEKYGTETPWESEAIKSKIQATCLEKYGVKNVFQADCVKDKIKSTTRDKYGVDNISQSSINKKKIKQTWENKSDQEIAEITSKREQTCFEKYGAKSYSCTQQAIDKTAEICLERYGVPYFCMTEECRQHSKSNSKPNKLFAASLDAANVSYEREFILQRKSYDFKVKNTLIEVNPTITHNSTMSIFGDQAPLATDYHFVKTKLAKDSGYHCINIWDWDDTDKVIRLLLQEKPRIFARKCEVRVVQQKDKTLFIQANHLQNDVPSEVNLGLYYNNRLISVMTFGKPRYNKNFEYELLRYCSVAQVIGGGKKLFAYFLRKYSPSSIISYCDLSKFSGHIYDELGFCFKGVSIGRHWYNIKTARHITDNLLRQRGFDQLFGTSYGKGTSNEELMRKNGYLEVYDAGQAKYVWADNKNDNKIQ